MKMIMRKRCHEESRWRPKFWWWSMDWSTAMNWSTTGARSSSGSWSNVRSSSKSWRLSLYESSSKPIIFRSFPWE